MTFFRRRNPLGMDKILDAGFEENIENLTNFQLVGVLEEQNRYKKEIGIQAKTEIDQRNLSQKEYQVLVQKYRSVDLIEQGKFKYGGPNISTLIFSIFLSLLFTSLIIGIVKSVIIIVAAIGIKIKYERGAIAENRLWFYFNLIIMLLICSGVGVLIFIEI